MTIPIRLRAPLMRGGKTLLFAAAVMAVTRISLDYSTIASASTAAFGLLIVVLLSAFLGDLLVGVVVSIVATLSFDYFFLPPVGTFTIAAFPDWVSLAAFLLASLIISRLTASAAETASQAGALSATLAQLKEFGQWLVTMPPDRVTLSGMANEAVRIFALEYCSIHVHAEGTWQHSTGSAAATPVQEIQTRLQGLLDRSADLMDLADESMLGVRYMQINRGTQPLALLAVRSRTLPDPALGAIAYMIGVQVNHIVRSQHPAT